MSKSAEELMRNRYFLGVKSAPFACFVGAFVVKLGLFRIFFGAFKHISIGKLGSFCINRDS